MNGRTWVNPSSAAHSASLRAFTPVFDGLWTLVNALILKIHIPETVVMGPRNGVPATHSASQTRVDALLLSRGAPRAGTTALRALSLLPGQPLACLRDHLRQSVVVGRRHHVSPRDAGDRRQLLDQLDRDAFALGGRIGGAFQPLDEVLRDDGAVEALLHPARRFRRAQRRNSDQEGDAPRRL